MGKYRWVVDKVKVACDNLYPRLARGQVLELLPLKSEEKTESGIVFDKGVGG